jgi:predicted alpha/beta hydrolase family esterase
MKKQKQILFLHSAGPQGKHEGSSDLVAYLEKELSHDYNVHFPKMPNPDNPEYEAWREKIEEELNKAEDGVILVGHSLGGSVLLKQLSEHPFNKQIAGLFLIATPYWGKEMKEYMLDDDFATKLPEIPFIMLYHSRHDEEVPVSHLRAYAKKLPKAYVRELYGDEHVFSSGIGELVQDIKSLEKTVVK